MSKISEYQDFAHRLEWCKQWLSLIGREYRGGGGGIGKVSSVDIKVTVYHQEYDGATNYHDIENPLRAALAMTIKQQMPRLLESAMAALELERLTKAKAAAEESGALMAAAGLGSPPAHTSEQAGT